MGDSYQLSAERFGKVSFGTFAPEEGKGLIHHITPNGTQGSEGSEQPHCVILTRVQCDTSESPRLKDASTMSPRTERRGVRGLNSPTASF